MEHLFSGFPGKFHWILVSHVYTFKSISVTPDGRSPGQPPYIMCLLWSFQEPFGKNEEADGNLLVLLGKGSVGSEQEEPADDRHPSLFPMRAASRQPRGSHRPELCP